MPRQHLEDNSLVTYQSSNDELPRSVQYAIGLCFTHKKNHFFTYRYIHVSYYRRCKKKLERKSQRR